MAKEEQTPLEPIESSATAARYLQYSIDLKPVLSFYMEDQKVQFEGQAASFDPSTFTLVAEITDPTFLALAKDKLTVGIGSEKIRLSFAVAEANVYASAYLTGRKLSHFSFGITLPIFKLQRRDFLRIRVGKEHQAAIAVKTQKWDIYDLSAGGFGFFISLADKDLFTLGDEIVGCKLGFLGKEFTVKAKVVSMNMKQKEQLVKIKVGMQFVNLPAGIEQAIVKEAYLHSHRMWSKWI